VITVSRPVQRSTSAGLHQSRHSTAAGLVPRNFPTVLNRPAGPVWLGVHARVRQGGGVPGICRSWSRGAGAGGRRAGAARAEGLGAAKRACPSPSAGGAEHVARPWCRPMSYVQTPLDGLVPSFLDVWQIGSVDLHA